MGVVQVAGTAQVELDGDGERHGLVFVSVIDLFPCAPGNGIEDHPVLRAVNVVRFQGVEDVEDAPGGEGEQSAEERGFEVHPVEGGDIVRGGYCPVFWCPRHCPGGGISMRHADHRSPNTRLWGPMPAVGMGSMAA